MSERMSVRLDPDQIAALDRIAAERHTNRSDALRHVLRQVLSAPEERPRVARSAAPAPPAPRTLPNSPQRPQPAHPVQIDASTWQKLQKRGRQ